MDDGPNSDYVTALKAGNSAAYERLLSDCKKDSSIWTTSRFDQDDLVQKTAVRIYQNIERYDPERSFDSWRRAIMKNLWLDQRKRKDHSTMTFTDLEKLTGKENLENWFEDRRTSRPLDHLHFREARDYVLNGHQELTQAQKDTINVSEIYQGGKSEPQTAQILDTNPGTIKSRKSVARQRLREIFANS